MPGTPPTPSPPGNPAGFKLPDGFATEIAIAGATTIRIWEKTVQPPGYDGGAPIDITTMRNLKWRTKHPKHLQDVTNMEIACAYDPNVYNDVAPLINVPTTITVTFPPGETGHGTGDTLCFYGYMMKFVPEPLKEGEFPTAAVTIVPTNTDPAGNEEGPVWTSGTGTS